MNLTPAYGETPLQGDEFDALVPEIRDLLKDSPSKAAVYDIEQRVQSSVAEELIRGVLNGSLDLSELLSDHFLRAVHSRLYSGLWIWAGIFRRHDFNIGVAPTGIAVDLRNSLESVKTRWLVAKDWSAKEVSLAAHAEILRIHPFTDGNGRTSRLLADLIYLCVQETEGPEVFDWEIHKKTYIGLLQDFDQNRQPTDLARFIRTQPLIS